MKKKVVVKKLVQNIKVLKKEIMKKENLNSPVPEIKTQ